MELDLSFLGEGPWTVESFSDGPNAARAARDYRREKAAISGHAQRASFSP